GHVQGVVDDVLAQVDRQVEHVFPARPAGGDPVGGLRGAVAADQVLAAKFQDVLTERERRCSADPIPRERDASAQEPHPISPHPRSLPGAPARGPSTVRGSGPYKIGPAARGLQRAGPVRAINRERSLHPAGQVKLTNWRGYSGPWALMWAMTACNSSIFFPVTRSLSSMICAWTLSLSCLMSLIILRASSVSTPVCRVSTSRTVSCEASSTFPRRRAPTGTPRLAIFSLRTWRTVSSCPL